MDFDIKGEVTRRYENSIWFLPQGGDKEVCLPREQIAIVEEVQGVTVTMPLRLAYAKKLITEDLLDFQEESQLNSIFIDAEEI